MKEKTENQINVSEGGKNHGVAVNTNYGSITNNNGLSPLEASQIAISLFHDNFPKLQQEAREIVDQRINEFCTEIFDRLKKSGFQNFQSFADPDIQYVLYEAQKEYARKGTPDLLNILSNVIIRRLENTDNLLNINLNEAVNVIGLLTNEQLNLLSIKFILGHTYNEQIKTINDLSKYIDEILLPLTNNLEKISTIDLRHLDYCGCGQSLLGYKLAIQLYYTYENLFILKKHEPETGLAGLKINTDIIVVDNDQEMLVDHYIKKHCPNSEYFFNLYDNMIYSFELTSMGILIGALNADAKTGETFELTKWFTPEPR